MDGKRHLYETRFSQCSHNPLGGGSAGRSYGKRLCVGILGNRAEYLAENPSITAIAV
jgi:hypothetical protein